MICINTFLCVYNYIHIMYLSYRGIWPASDVSFTGSFRTTKLGHQERTELSDLTSLYGPGMPSVYHLEMLYNRLMMVNNNH